MSFAAHVAPVWALAALAIHPASAEVEREIPLGIETVAGVRSGYVYRGMQLAGSLMDFEVETEIALGDTLLLNTGGWLASAAGADFLELAGFADLRAEMNEFYALGASLTYHDYDDSPLRDGFDLGAFLTMFPSDRHKVTMGAYHDFGAEAWYAKFESDWSVPLAAALSFSLLNGLSWTDGFNGIGGMNDLYGRASLTYAVRDGLLLTPFVGWSLELDDGDGDEVFGGLWLEVLF